MNKLLAHKTKNGGQITNSRGYMCMYMCNIHIYIYISPPRWCPSQYLCFLQSWAHAQTVSHLDIQKAICSLCIFPGSSWIPLLCSNSDVWSLALQDPCFVWYAALIYLWCQQRSRFQSKQWTLAGQWMLALALAGILAKFNVRKGHLYHTGFGIARDSGAQLQTWRNNNLISWLCK